MRKQQITGVFLTILLLITALPSITLGYTDVTTDVQINKSRLGFDRITGENFFTVSITNISTEAISGPIHLVVENIAPDTVTVANADTLVEGTQPAFTFTQLETGQTSATKTVRFNNHSRVRFTFTNRVLAEAPMDALAEQLFDYYSLDPNGDYDNDGLTNGFETETMSLKTVPDNSDSDGDGVNDGSEDTDQDGLSNLEEQQYGTNPLQADSDQDGLSDFEEINTHGTDPLNPDSDGDNVNDGDEIKLGTDPNAADSDGDGVPDGDEVIENTVTNVEANTEVVVNAQGSVLDKVTIQLIEGASVFNDPQNTAVVPNTAVEVETTESNFLSAIVKIYLTEEILQNYDVNNLKMVYFDEVTNTYVPLQNQGYNSQENYIWGETSHFTVFALIDEVKLTNQFSQPFNDSSRGNGEFIDIVFCLDSSGSMSWNDPSNLRRSASKTLIDGLRAEDQAAVVDFDSSVRTWQTLTMDKEAAKRGIDRVDSSGGTNIGAGVSSSIDELLARSHYDNRIIILLTDGDGSYNHSLTTKAANNNIIIHTIGLGSGVNASLLRSIASGTGGNYYQVSRASDLITVFDDLRQETQDTDEDGLPDYAETNGMRTGLGYSIFTDQNHPDTDGDGLKDGEEMGTVLINYLGQQYYKMISDPTKEDTDSDTVNDYNELKGSHEYPNKPEYKSGFSQEFSIDYSPETGTNPLKSDSDGDGISDFYDRYPNQFDWYGKYRKGDIIVVGHSWEEISDEAKYACRDKDGFEYTACTTLYKLAMYQWSHAVMYMGNEKTLDAHPVRPSSDGSNDGAVGWGNIHEFLYHPNYNKIAFLRVESKNDEASSRAGDEAEKYRGVPFLIDFEDITSPTSNNYLYCAELVHKSWMVEGVDLRPLYLPLPWVRPNDLYTDTKTKILKRMGCLECGENMPHARP